MEENIKKTKFNVLKRILGKKMFVITNSLTEDGYCGIVSKIIDHETVQIFSDKKEENVSIFDLRNPSRIYDCE